VPVEIMIRWALVGLALSGVVCMFWYFTGIFFKKTKSRVLTVLIMVLFCSTLYVITHIPPKSVRMKENVLYIKPMSENDIK